ncbi:MAG: putative motility protein [Phycisphaerales bacterium]|nr:putative motility protein [Phycisphaerales bacterium]
MEITAASASAMMQAQISDQVSVRVARLAQDQAKAEGDAAVQLIEAAAEVGRQVNRCGGSAGCGRVDVYA